MLVNISSKAWALKILALMDSGVPGRQAPLIAAAGASRPTFVASLNHLVDLELLEKNPGHGHPLRPEFRLTPQGALAASLAGRIINAVPNDAALNILKRSWTVPILATTQSPQRFAAIKTTLGRVTDRALSQSLLFLEKREWLRRDIVVSERTMFPTYQAIHGGAEVSRIIQANVCGSRRSLLQ